LDALQDLGIPIEEYHTYEILKPAIEISSKRFPFIIHHGNVEAADWNLYQSIDLIIAGSPCINLSKIRQENKEVNSGLEGKDSGLFWHFAEALKIIKPKWFMLENVEPTDKNDLDIITETVGAEPTPINSNLFTAQDRQRLYWTNIPISPLPKSCAIVLKDIMEKDVDEKYYYEKPFILHGEDKKIAATLQVNSMDISKRVYSPNFKCGTLTCINGGYQEKKVLDNGRVRKLTPIEYERLQGLEDNYTLGYSDTVRRSLCGNGWTKPVIKHIFAGLKNQL
jgi:site-specific DNA-cytosine methylase